MGAEQAARARVRREEKGGLSPPSSRASPPNTPTLRPPPLRLSDEAASAVFTPGIFRLAPGEGRREGGIGRGFSRPGAGPLAAHDLSAVYERRLPSTERRHPQMPVRTGRGERGTGDTPLRPPFSNLLRPGELGETSQSPPPHLLGTSSRPGEFQRVGLVIMHDDQEEQGVSGGTQPPAGSRP